MLVLALAGVLGCSSKSAFHCAGSEQCVQAGMPGVCEPQGFCSFADPGCAGGRRFEPNAGNGLGGTCVEVDAAMPPCGAGGQACCASEPACIAGLTCNAGTCGSCIEDVAPGRHAMCVLHKDHTIWCAGENQYGQLGVGLSGPNRATWMQVRDSTSLVISDAAQISTGWEFTCAVRTGGTVWCWGYAATGQMGNNTAGGAPAAVQVLKAPGQPLTNIAEVSAGQSHACARDTAGGVWCWGANNRGQIGDGTTTQRNVATPVLDAAAGPALTGALDLDVGADHACVLKAGDALWCWGINNRGQLGDGTTPPADRLSPVSVGSAVKFTTGNMTTCVMRADESVLCTGDAWRNRIGNGAPVYDTISYYSTPERVLTAPGGAPLTGVDTIVSGGANCALMKDTSVLCWGDDTHGQIGTGGGSTTPAPVLMADGTPLEGVDRIVTKRARVCARRTGGDWWCWGRNLEGALGDGTFVNRSVPVPLGGGCP